MLSIKFSKWEGPYLKYNMFNLTWHLGNFCNYHCSYCPSYLNNGTMNSWVPLDIAKKVLDNVESQRSDKNIMFILSGGEPTVHPNLIELVEYAAKEKNIFVTVITNGSRSPAYYKKLASVLNGSAVFSFHFEFGKFDKFVESLRAFTEINPRAFVHFIMNPNYWDDAVKYFEYLVQEDFKVVPKTLVDDMTGPNENQAVYTASQKEYLVKANEISTKNMAFKNGLSFPHKYVWKNNITVGDALLIDFVNDLGERETTSVHSILAKKQNMLLGTKCWVGVEGLHIGYRGDVFKGACQQDGVISNIYSNPNFAIPSNPTICTKKLGCWCVDDLKYTKSSSQS